MEAIGSFFTTVLYQPLFNALMFLVWLIPGHSIGWAIILLTLVVRFALLPTSAKNFEHQRRMKALQPKLNDLKERHGKDQASHSKAVMELYASEKVNPLSGCLPLLVQLPILIVLYRVFLGGLAEDNFNLLYSFVPRLEHINTHWLGLDLTKPEKYVLPLLAGLTQWYQTKQMQMFTPLASPVKKDGDAGSPEDFSQTMAKQMLLIGPAMSFFITFTLPAALGLYWVATNTFMIVQQLYFMTKPEPQLTNSLKTKDDVTVTIRSKGAPDGQK